MGPDDDDDDDDDDESSLGLAYYNSSTIKSAAD